MTDARQTKNAASEGTSASPCSPCPDCYGAFHKQWYEVRDDIPESANLYTVAKTFWAWAWEASRKHHTANTVITQTDTLQNA